jgi:hypothetical protein
VFSCDLEGGALPLIASDDQACDAAELVRQAMALGPPKAPKLVGRALKYERKLRYFAEVWQKKPARFSRRVSSESLFTSHHAAPPSSAKAITCSDLLPAP